ncbi:hypothetical protein [Empedobacter brevis]|uniref:hypothetical protein n=1 Tax=Empedobacter brevis TaxID=247 RepID=UPI0023F01813|nr:hypothetical protein [Empedobacter brevis]
MKSFLESLKLYLEVTPKDQVIDHWELFQEYDGIGMGVNDFLMQSLDINKLEIEDSYWEFNYLNQILINPEFTSGFFLF